MKKVNSKTKSRKLSKRKEKLVFSRLEMGRVDERDNDFKTLELEKGFKKI